MVSRRDVLRGGMALGGLALAGCAPGEDDAVLGTDGGRYAVDDHAVLRQGWGGWRYGGLGTGPDALNAPSALIPGPEGTLLVVDRGNDRVVCLDRSGSRVGVLGTSGQGVGELRMPSAGCCDPFGQVWIADTLNHRVQVFSAVGARVIGADVLEAPADVAIDASGFIHVVDKAAACVHVFHADGTWVRQYGGRAEDEGGLVAPRRIEIDGDVVWVVDAVGGAVQSFDADGWPLERRTSEELGGVPVDIARALSGGISLRLAG